MTRLIAFDLEGILVEEEFLVELAKATGKEEEVHKITEDGLNGSIEWEIGLKKRIGILKGLDYETVKRIATQFTLIDGVKELIQKLKEKSFKIAIITGGFKIITEEVVKELEIDYFIANEFVFNDGKLKNCKINVNKNKDYWLKKFAKDCKAEFVIAIGDGENDIDMLKSADCGVFIKGKNLHIFKDVIKNIVEDYA